MSEQIDWSKAPEGAMVLLKHVRDDSYAWAVSHSEDARAWHKRNIKCSFHLMASMWTVVAERQTTQSWSGEGLPPVGAVCELRCLPVGGWGKAEIKYMSETQCVWRWLREDGGYQVELAEVPDVTRMAFRQIRTPEQIAADERDEAIKRACEDIDKLVAAYNMSIDCSAAIRATIEAMIDKGYSKP